MMKKTARRISKNESTRHKDVVGPSLMICNEHAAPLFCFIFRNRDDRDKAADRLRAILKSAVWAGASG